MTAASLPVTVPGPEPGTGRRELPVAALVATLAGLVVLGPALGRGVVLSYDLAWSPDPRVTPFVVGIGTPAPRAVPSDAAAVALGSVLGAGPAQALVLLGVLVLAGVGTARLARLALAAPGLAGPAVAAFAGVWNPFVLERLVVGQWTVLLGYAATPHLLLAARTARTDRRHAALLAAGVVACGVGGANTLVLALLAVLPVLLVPRVAVRPLLLSLGAAAGAGAVWALPALGAGVRSTAEAAAAFAPRPDTPLGTALSLLSGGAFWNPATHPAERMVPVVAVAVTTSAAAAALALWQALRRRRSVPLLLPGALGLALAVLSALDPAGVWTRVVTDVPGGGLLRDAQKLVAPAVVVVAAGIGVLAVRLAARRPAGPAGAVLVAALPVLCLPSLAWGVAGRLAAVEVPADVREVATQLSAAPPGTVGLLPWSQYRRYAWNADRISLTLVPRMVDQRVLLDDSLPLASGRVAGEDPATARVTAAIEAGTDPVQALRDEGARYLLLERRVGAAGPGTDVVVPPGAVVLADTADSLVLDLDPAAGPLPTGLDAAGRAGWALSLATALAALALAGHAVTRATRRRRRGGATRW